MRKRNRKRIAIGLAAMMVLGTLGNTGVTARAEDVVEQETEAAEVQSTSSEIVEEPTELSAEEAPAAETEMMTEELPAEEIPVEEFSVEETKTEEQTIEESEVEKAKLEESEPEQSIPEESNPQESETSEEFPGESVQETPASSEEPKSTQPAENIDQIVENPTPQSEESGKPSVFAFNGDVYDMNNEKLTINSENKDQFAGKVITGTLENQGVNQFVIDGVEISLTFRDLTVQNAGAYNNSPASGLVLKNGAILHLTLEGNNVLKAGYAGAGITVPEGCTLEITGNSIGSLTASGGGGWNAGAGIGADGRAYRSVGTIIIRGGTVKATGNNSYSYGSVSAASAGIGGTAESKSGTIQITGGTVEATGGMYAAGIGGGSNGRTERIEISGGTVTATGGSQYSYSGAAIGSGHNSWNVSLGGEKLSCGEILITNGTIHAEGNIGYGTKLDVSENEDGSVDITGPVQLELTRGEIAPRKAGSTYGYYKTEFQIYDTRLGTETAEHSVVVQIGSQMFSSSISISEAYTGTVSLGMVDTQGILKQDAPVKIVDMKTDLSWLSTLSFAEEGEHTVSVGKPFYPVNLCFMDSSITGEIAINSLKVTDETGEAYTMVNGRMANETTIRLENGRPETGMLRAWLPEGTYTFTIDTGKPEWGTNGVITVQGTVKADSTGTTILAYRGDTAVVQDDIDLSKGDITFGISNGLLTISMTDAEGNVKKYENQPWDLTYTITTSEETDHQVRMNLAAGYRLNLKLKNVKIDRTNVSYSYGIQMAAVSLMTPGTAAIYLEGENTIKSVWGAVLIENVKGQENSHLIFEESSGALWASGASSNPVIGGDNSKGSVEINGGTITAENNQGSSTYQKGAAIGSGSRGFVSVKINGGTVSATASQEEAAIGDAYNYYNTSSTYDGSAAVEITGGNVTVENTEGKRALGKTKYSDGNVKITGGTVIVKQGYIEADTMVVTGGTIYQSDGSQADIKTEVKTGTGADAQTARYTTADLSCVYGKNAAVTDVEGFDRYGFQNVTTDPNGKLHLYLPIEEGGLLSGSFTGITFQGRKADPVILSNFWMNMGTIEKTGADLEIQGLDQNGTVYYQIGDTEVSAEELIRSGTALTLKGKRGTAKLENLIEGMEYTISAVYVVNGKHGGVHQITFRSESAEPPLVNGYYEISTVDQMVWFGKEVEQHSGINGKLMADLDLSGIAWKSMGRGNAGYSGTFDGNGHVIRNLKVAEGRNVYHYGQGVNSRAAGFFGYVGLQGKIRNLGIENAEITPQASEQCQYGGVLAGFTYNCKIENCYTGGNITFENTVSTGGMIGIMGYSDCYYSYTTYSSFLGGRTSEAKNLTGCYYQAAKESASAEYGDAKTPAQFQNGEVTWRLNNGQTNDNVVWRQTLAASGFPSFQGRIVYQNEAGTYSNNTTFETPTADQFTYIPPEELKQNGEKKEALVYLNAGITGMGSFTVRYKKSGGTSYLTSAPTEAGTYEVWISLSDGTRYNGGELQMGSFTITEPEIVSVDITWGSLKFEYHDGQWNPETCRYTESGWTTAQEDDASITVTNSGNVAVDVEYRFAAAEDLTEVKNLQGIFVDEEDQPMDTLSVPADNKPKKTELRLESDKPTESFSKTIGTITIVIKE